VEIIQHIADGAFVLSLIVLAGAGAFQVYYERGRGFQTTGLIDVAAIIVLLASAFRLGQLALFS